MFYNSITKFAIVGFLLLGTKELPYLLNVIKYIYIILQVVGLVNEKDVFGFFLQPSRS